MSTLGLIIVLAAVAAYAVMLFVIHRFTYRTWIFDAAILAGMLFAIAGWLANGVDVQSILAIVFGALWFPLLRRELRIQGSKQLNLRPGDTLPSMHFVTTDGVEFTDRDLIAKAPTLLVLYRGWWCPSHRSQLDELVGAHRRLAEAGLAVYAASVDSPNEAAAIQERVGDKITILCNTSTSLLDNIGVRDFKGAPWYDRLIFGAKRQEIAMPAAIVIDPTGVVVYSYRATRVDDRPDPDRILTNLRSPSGG